MADRTRPVVWESTSKGGSSDESYPKEIDPNEDGIDTRSVFFQNDSSVDSNVHVTRDSSGNMVFTDIVAGSATLTQLLNGVGMGYLYGYKLAYVNAYQVQLGEGIARSSDDTTWIKKTSSLTADLTSSGANGLDTGSEASDTWYYVYVIYNPTTEVVASLLSESVSSPTMPSGYTKSRLVGTCYNDGSGNIRGFVQFGLGNLREYFFTEVDVILVDGGTDLDWVDVDASEAIPETSSNFVLSLKNTGGVAVQVFVRINGTTADCSLCIVGRDGVVHYQFTDSNRVFEYKASNGAVAQIHALGYREEL